MSAQLSSNLGRIVRTLGERIPLIVTYTSRCQSSVLRIDLLGNLAVNSIITYVVKR